MVGGISVKLYCKDAQTKNISIRIHTFNPKTIKLYDIFYHFRSQ